MSFDEMDYMISALGRKNSEESRDTNICVFLEKKSALQIIIKAQKEQKQYRERKNEQL